MAVTGNTAYTSDFIDLMKTAAPLVFGFVLLLAFGAERRSRSARW